MQKLMKAILFIFGYTVLWFFLSLITSKILVYFYPIFIGGKSDPPFKIFGFQFEHPAFFVCGMLMLFIIFLISLIHIKALNED